MSTKIAGRKSNWYCIGLALALMVLLISVVMPIGATPPEDMHFDIQVTYALGNFTTVNGDWSSGGLFAGAGGAVQTAHHAGWPGNGWQFQTAHFITTLSDESGTITVKDQSTQIEWSGPDATGSGHWVIQDASGTYAQLHGTGESTFQATFYPVCPDPSTIGPCLILEMQLDGNGHSN